MISVTKRCIRIVVGAVLGIVLLTSPARAQSAIPQPCVDDTLPSGALSRICVPIGWNGQLVVFAHGYVAPGLPIAFYNLTLPDGSSLPDMVQSFGFAFATTSYRQNGLAILEGADDMLELVAQFGATHAIPLRTYVSAVSEGSLVAALLAERSPDVFFGALATCGPIGSFNAQIDYIGNFRVLFDYFFPGIIPASPIAIPPAVATNWYSTYVPAIIAALAVQLELLRVAKAPYDPANPSTIVNGPRHALVQRVCDQRRGSQARRQPVRQPADAVLRIEQRSPVEPSRRAVRGRSGRAGRAASLSDERRPEDSARHAAHDRRRCDSDLAGAAVSAQGKHVRAGPVHPAAGGRYGHCSFTTNEILGAFLLTVSQP
jgi:hypothetical protein